MKRFGFHLFALLLAVVAALIVVVMGLERIR